MHAIALHSCLNSTPRRIFARHLDMDHQTIEGIRVWMSSSYKVSYHAPSTTHFWVKFKVGQYIGCGIMCWDLLGMVLYSFSSLMIFSWSNNDDAIYLFTVFYLKRVIIFFLFYIYPMFQLLFVFLFCSGWIVFGLWVSGLHKYSFTLGDAHNGCFQDLLRDWRDI